MRKRFVHEPDRLIQRGLYYRIDAQALRLLIDAILNCGGHVRDQRVPSTSRRFVVIDGGRQR
jgi:hypothetical protein